MKKTLFIIAACALAAASCQKETAVENVVSSEAVFTVTATIATDGSCTITDGKKYVTLTFGTPVTLDSSTPTAFYIAVPADSRYQGYMSPPAPTFGTRKKTSSPVPGTGRRVPSSVKIRPFDTGGFFTACIITGKLFPLRIRRRVSKWKKILCARCPSAYSILRN